MNFEEPILPPGGDGNGGRFESADLDIEELRQFFLDTKFESEESIIDMLSRDYHMHRRDDVEEITMGMTRRFKGITPDEIERMKKGERVHGDIGVPLSGIEPQAVARMTIATADENQFDLRIFKVFNRNEEFRYEYILNSLPE
jgi:hypothetical protein